MLYRTLLLLLFFVTPALYAQEDTLRNQPLPLIQDTASNQDTVSNQPSVLPVRDTTKLPDTVSITQRRKVAKPAGNMLGWQQDTAYTKLYKNLFSGTKKQAVFRINAIRPPTNKDEIFYMLTGLLLLVAAIRSGFPKYFQNILRLFFQSAYRQKQSKESLLQDNMPSLLLNIMFLLSGGLLIALLAAGSPQLRQLPMWLLWLYACGTLAVIYLSKYLFISFCGWAFNVQQFAFNYNFIVFLVNKVAGICLLPLLLILAFSQGDMYHTAATVSVTLLILMLVYRYIVALSTVAKNLKINAVHFFIYLCAVEILPLLVIYKLMFIIIG